MKKRDWTCFNCGHLNKAAVWLCAYCYSPR